MRLKSDGRESGRSREARHSQIADDFQCNSNKHFWGFNEKERKAENLHLKLETFGGNTLT